MKKYLPLIILAVISPFTHATSNNCEVTVRANIPKNLNLAQLKLELYTKQVPIDSYKFETCTTYKELSVSKRHFSNSNVGIIHKYENGATYILKAAVHQQTKIIDMNAISTVAQQACPNQCGFYEYEKLKTDTEIQNLAKQYNASLTQQSAKTTRTEAAKALGKYSEQAQQRYKQLLPNAPKLPNLEKGDGYLSSPYGGTYKFFPKEPSQAEVFESLFEPRKDAFLKKVGKRKFKKISKPLKSLAREMYSSRYKWDKFLVKSKEFSTAMRATNEPMLIEYVDIVDQTIEEATKKHQKTVTRLRSLSGTPFKNLTNRNISFGDLMGYWSYIAYHQAELNEKEAFATLFSQHYLQKTAPKLPQQTNADKSVSYLIAMFNLLLGKNYDYHMQRIKGEFDNTAKLNGNRYSLKDGFIDLAFVYENGAWRLDHIQMANLN